MEVTKLEKAGIRYGNNCPVVPWNLYWLIPITSCVFLGKVMDGRAEMEVIRSTKGNATGEVSVHLVASENTVQNAHLPATTFIIPGECSNAEICYFSASNSFAVPFFHFYAFSIRSHTQPSHFSSFIWFYIFQVDIIH